MQIGKWTWIQVCNLKWWISTGNHNPIGILTNLLSTRMPNKIFGNIIYIESWSFKCKLICFKGKHSNGSLSKRKNKKKKNQKKRWFTGWTFIFGYYPLLYKMTTNKILIDNVWYGLCVVWHLEKLKMSSVTPLCIHFTHTHILTRASYHLAVIQTCHHTAVCCLTLPFLPSTPKVWHKFT